MGVAFVGMAEFRGKLASVLDNSFDAVSALSSIPWGLVPT